MRHFASILIVSTLAMAMFPHDAAAGGQQPVPPAKVEVGGAQARAVAAAFGAFEEKLPEAKIEQYSVVVEPAGDGGFQVDFVPGFAPGETPTPGGRTSLGRGLTVWISAGDYQVQKVAFAR